MQRLVERKSTQELLRTPLSGCIVHVYLLNKSNDDGNDDKRWVDEEKSNGHVKTMSLRILLKYRTLCDGTSAYYNQRRSR